MRRRETYYGLLETIVGDADAIEQEKKRLDAIIAEEGAAIRKRLTPQTVPGLLWYLAVKELERIAPLVGIPVSDFSGHARYLRALCAAVPFESVEPSDDPKAEELFEHCGRLWSAMFHRETIDDLKLVGIEDVDRQQRIIGTMTSLLDAFQGELSYIDQVEDRVERLFTPFSAEIIEPALGVSPADIIKGFHTVRVAIPQRIKVSANLMEPARELWEEWRKRSREGVSDEELDRLVFGHPGYDDIGNKVAASIRDMNHILLFRPDDFRDDLGNRAAAFLDAFSFVPGEVNLGVKTPYDDDIVRRRPFAKIADDKFVLVDVGYSSFSPPHRLLELFDTDRKIQRLNKRRDDTLEDEAAQLFNSVVNADAVLQSYYLPVGKDGVLAERDLLVLKRNCAFVIESKARPLRPVKQRRDKLVRIAADGKHSIQEGYNQACGVIRHMRATDGPIPIFDSDGLQTSELDVSSIDQFFPVVFLDSYYGPVAADLGPWLILDEAVGFPWVVDRNTFASIILKIDSFEKIKNFLEWRRTLHGVAVNEDEAVFAGFFLTHGACTMPDNARVQLSTDYADIFEAEFFRRKGFDVEIPPENIGPPVFSSMERVGDEIKFKINGKVKEVINIKTGEGHKTTSPKKPPRTDGKVRRNDPCPCGSGKKFKKCCMRPR